MAEEFARVLAWARGLLMLEWCQNKALCALCAWWSEACVFDAPSMGLRCDTSVCLPCHVSYEKCLILLEWQAVCIAAEQGWDEDWVRSQLGKVQKTWVSGEGSTEWSVGQVGPLWSGWREGASSAADHEKWRASSLSEAGLSKRPQGHELMAGPSGFHIYSPTPGRTLRMGVKFSGAPAFDHRGLSSQVGGGANGGIDGMGGGALMGKGGLRRGTGGEGGVRVGAEHLGASGTGASTREEVEEWEMAPEGGLLWAELEVARRREDWLANEAALGHAGILCWVQEHWVLLDGASAAFASIQDGLAQMPVGQPLELQQGMARVGRLLAGHWQRNAVALGSWWEVVADAGEALPELAEVLAVVWAQMEIDLGVAMLAGGAEVFWQSGLYADVGGGMAEVLFNNGGGGRVRFILGA
ncbi:hypothetical protein E4T56_gene255 [Termitomyces sp. T112]|nr:hypothetical protein E4T56_gene255 [Termitomyces sp. T112]